MDFTYKESYDSTPVPEAYEALLLDVLQGDATLFMRADQVEAAWAVVMPILDAWKAHAAPHFPNYAAGTWGPEAAQELVHRDGFRWALLPDKLVVKIKRFTKPVSNNRAGLFYGDQLVRFETPYTPNCV